jgi:hypothetical protein
VSIVPQRGRPLARKPKAGYHRPVLRLAPKMYEATCAESNRLGVSASEFVRRAIAQRFVRRATPKGKRADAAWAPDDLDAAGPVDRNGFPTLRVKMPRALLDEVRLHAISGGEAPEDWMADAVTMRLERDAQEAKAAK